MTVDDPSQPSATPPPVPQPAPILQPPAVPPLLPQAPPVPGAAGFRDPSTLTKVVKVLLYIALALDAVAVLSGLLEFQLLQDIRSGAISGPDMTAAADANDLRQRIIGLTQVALYLITIIVFARWIYVLSANKSRLGASELRFTPGWAVGWFFIPIANLWKPYQAMKELWRVSADPLRWRDVHRSALLPWWWFVWLLNNVLGQLSFQLGRAATEFSQIVAANVITDLADASSVALDIIGIVLVGRIAGMQLAPARAAAG
jgi:Domain of unknown function (DUF4328)